MTTVVLLLALLAWSGLRSAAPVATGPVPTPQTTAASPATATPAPADDVAAVTAAGPSGGLKVGFRASVYGVTPTPSPDYWYRVGSDARSKFSGSGVQGIWVIGCYLDDGRCYLNFPSSASYSSITFADTDENEAYLDYFDRVGLPVYLQVEPGQASVEDLIQLVLDRYGKHRCVCGFGVDVEWYQARAYSGGRPVTDSEAAAWYRLVSSYNKSYRLFLKHYSADWMPPSYRTGIYFIDDSMGFSSLDAMVDEFARWRDHFSGSPVGFQIGYQEDKGWWSRYPDPLGTIGRALLEQVPDTEGIYWVDFSVEDLYPA